MSVIMVAWWTSRSMRAAATMASPRLLRCWACSRRSIHCWAVAKKESDARAWQALIASAIARWLLPVPGGPKKQTFLCSEGRGELGEVEDQRLLGGGLGAEVEVLERLVGGERGVADAVARPGRVTREDLGYDTTPTTQEKRQPLMGFDLDAELYDVTGPIHWGDSGGPLVQVKTGKALGIVSRLCARACQRGGPDGPGDPGQRPRPAASRSR